MRYEFEYGSFAEGGPPRRARSRPGDDGGENMAKGGKGGKGGKEAAGGKGAKEAGGTGETRSAKNAKGGQDEEALYNLEGGQRNLIWKDGELRAVAPGLRVVEATDQEKQGFEEKHPRKKKPRDYGLPV
jgi:hypothetical protein